MSNPNLLAITQLQKLLEQKNSAANRMLDVIRQNALGSTNQRDIRNLPSEHHLASSIFIFIQASLAKS